MRVKDGNNSYEPMETRIRRQNSDGVYEQWIKTTTNNAVEICSTESNVTTSVQPCLGWQGYYNAKSFSKPYYMYINK